MKPRVVDPVGGSPTITAPMFHELLDKTKLVSAKPFPKGCVSKKADTAAVILAGGSGERFGHPGGKQLIEILGRPVLSWAISAFDACEQIGHIVVVCPKYRADDYKETAIDPFDFKTPITICYAGMLRQESSMNGVESVPLEYKFIAIHDGARPLVTAELVTHTINVLKGNLDADGAVVGHPAIDTMKVVENETIVGTPDRSMFWIAQTPQIFHANICRQAHAAAMSEGYVGTDDSSLVERIGGKVLLVPSPRNNIKVTVPEDLGPVTAALESRILSHED